jgi:hypothetical protein
MKTRRRDAGLTWGDFWAGLIVVVMIVGLVYLLADAIDADAEFTKSRLSQHRTMVFEAQEEVRLAEVTQ